jgi:putative phosphoesterase
MTSIALISDTHGYFGEDVNKYLVGVDEVWHAGDIGDVSTLEKYESLGKTFRAVYGNIDGHRLRRDYEEYLDFEIDGLKVLMIHIGGYPGRYSKEAYALINQKKYDLFISGHSHITKVMRDPKHNLIHMNPGSCGHHGFHLMRTLIRFKIDAGQIRDLEVIELGRRGVTR